MRMSRTLIALALLPMVLGGCDLDLQNPNSPTDEEVLTSTDGLIANAVGMQALFALQMDAFVQGPALVTDEWGTTTLSLPSYRELFIGEVTNEFLIVEEPWASGYEVINAADDLIENAPEVGLGEGLEVGIVSLARLYRAMALGMLIQQFQELPLETGVEAPELRPRDAVLSEVIDLLETARSDLMAAADADFGAFEDRVLADGFDLRNTVDAMLARYHLVSGNHQAAIDAADRVDPDVLSVFTYTANDRNPVENLSLQLGYVLPLQSFAEQAEEEDQRVAFWADVASDPVGGNPADTLLLQPELYSAPTDPFPVYLPDEMKLIRAEAHTRLGNFGPARQEIDEVRTQESSPVNEPVAGLDPIPDAELDTEEELIEQIAYERRYELYLQGLRWEDARRLGAEATVVPTVQFLPIPQQECQTNPAAGC